MFLNRRQYSLGVLKQHPVLEADHPDALLLDILCSVGLVLVDVRTEVSGAVQLDNQPAIGTVKIDNVRSNADLPPELLSEFAMFQQIPKHGLRRHGRLTECLA